MTAKGYLERVQHIDMLIKNKTVEKERYRELTMEITTSVTTYEFGQSTIFRQQAENG